MVRKRFVRLEVVARELGLTAEELLGIIRSGELLAVSLCGTWRVERTVLEQFIGRLYERSARMLADPPHAGTTDEAHDRPDTAGSERDDDVPEVQPPDVAALTPQMRRVLELLAAGMSNAEIATELTLEVSTVKSHVSRLLSRLGLPNRERLIAFAWRSGVIGRET